MTLSKCFAPIPSDEWSEVISEDWPSFLEELSRDLSKATQRERILDALAAPPDPTEKSTFAARHFTGGLPDSAMPIESLYTRKMPSDIPEYYQEPALYMTALIESMGYQVPEGFRTYPDHLALELEMLGILLDSNEEDARDFARSRFLWLPEFGAKLEGFGAEGAFYAAAVEAVVTAIEGWLENE